MLGAVFILVGLAVCAPMVLAAGRFARAMRGNARVARALDWLFASVFAGFAAHLLFRRVR